MYLAADPSLAREFKRGSRYTGRVRLMVSGASPLGSDVMDFLRICFSAPVIEGYGLTESSSCCSATVPEETRPGHVGGPVPCVEIKLADIPDMNYTNADKPHPRGEVSDSSPLLWCAFRRVVAFLSARSSADGPRRSAGVLERVHRVQGVLQR